MQDGRKQIGTVTDGKIQTLLLAFAAAPALEELDMQFTGALSISGKCLMSVHSVSFGLLPSDFVKSSCQYVQQLLAASVLGLRRPVADCRRCT